MIERKDYLEQLISKKGNGLIKIITGIRRCGKSYLLFEIFHRYLNSIGVDNNHIIKLSLDELENIKYRNPLELSDYLKSLIVDTDEMYYIFIDEIQKVKTIPNPYLNDKTETVGFVDVLLSLRSKKNVDVYVTGSNSKMLSYDVLTEFRGKGDEIHLHPLSYREFASAFDDNTQDIWQQYLTYGGLPYICSLKDHREKAHYLTNLFENIYLRDILERYRIHEKALLDTLLDIISSSVGSLTNPKRIADTFATSQGIKVQSETIAQYLDYFADAFLIRKAHRFDIKGRKYIGTPLKYYYTDVGLRNARLNFRQVEETHLMENIIYNELIRRGHTVDVGVVGYNYRDESGKMKKTNLEIDFVTNDISNRLYIQSALSVGDDEKRLQEIRPYKLVNDSFKKMIIVKDPIVPRYDDLGVLYIGIEQFLREETVNI